MVCMWTTEKDHDILSKALVVDCSDSLINLTVLLLKFPIIGNVIKLPACEEFGILLANA